MCALLLINHRPDETQITRTIWNDASPRWGDSFDFVMVSAGSRLTITMMDATSLFEMVASLKLSKVGWARLQSHLQQLAVAS